MSYTYRHKKTKATITTTNKVHGKNWELVEDEKVEGNTFQDDTPEDDTPEDDTAEETPSEPAEEVPAPKPKTSRRGKK